MASLPTADSGSTPAATISIAVVTDSTLGVAAGVKRKAEDGTSVSIYRASVTLKFRAAASFHHATPFRPPNLARGNTFWLYMRYADRFYT